MHWFQWFDWFAVKVKNLIRWWLFWGGGRQHCWLQFGWVLDRLSSRFSCLLFDWIGSGNSTNQVTGSVSNVLAFIKWIRSWSIQGWWKRWEKFFVFARRPILRLVWLLPVCSARRSSNMARWGWQQMKVTKQEETSWKPPWQNVRQIGRLLIAVHYYWHMNKCGYQTC